MKRTYAKLDRRALLKNAALAAFLGPVVRRTMARAATPVRRLLVVFWPNGLNHKLAGPHTVGSDFSLGEYFAPLERHKPDTVALSMLHVGGVPYGTNSEFGHKSGGIGCLTCTPDMKTGKATGPSVDQFIAQQLFDQKLAPMRRAPIFGVGAAKLPGYGPIFHEAAGKVAPTEPNPKLAYEQLFADVAASMGQDVGKVIARRKSILDVALADCRSARPALPAEGRALLDYHCDRIRDLEASVGGAVRSCEPPRATLEGVAALNFQDPNHYPVLTDFFWKLLQVGFLCDLSRVQSFVWGGTAARFNMPWLDIPLIDKVDTGERNVRDHHSHTHAGTRESIGLFMNWYATKMAALLDLFKQRGPDGTRLLDSTVVHFTTEYGAGGAHFNGDFSCFLFGSGGGVIRTNQHFTTPKSNAERHHALMVSLIKYMGIKGVESFGHPMGGSGPIPELFV